MLLVASISWIHLLYPHTEVHDTGCMLASISALHALSDTDVRTGTACFSTRSLVLLLDPPVPQTYDSRLRCMHLQVQAMLTAYLILHMLLYSYSRYRSAYALPSCTPSRPLLISVASHCCMCLHLQLLLHSNPYCTVVDSAITFSYLLHSSP